MSPVFERKTVPLWSQLLIVTHRHALYTFYMLHGLRGMLARNVAAGVLYGILYHRNGTKLWETHLIIDPQTLKFK